MGFDLDAEDLKACLDDVDEVNWKFESSFYNFKIHRTETAS